MKTILAHLNKEVEVARLVDRNTGVVVHEIKLGRNYHWYILTALAVISYLIRHW